MQVNDNQLEFKTNNNEKCEINSIWNCIIYIKELIIKYLPKFYYLAL